MRILLLITVLVFSCNKVQSLYPDPDTIIEGQLDWQKNSILIELLNSKQPIGKNKIVFLGNSIIKGGGDWNQRYGLNNIVNRGYLGITPREFLRGWMRFFYKPVSVVLMIGINEFFADNSERPGINPKYVADNIFKIADIINDYSPKTKIFIHTILPINNDQYIEVKK